MPTLSEHPAVTSHGDGIYTSDLADFTRTIAEAAALRIEGIGAEQYERESGQKFEEMTQDQLVAELLDEVADVQSYLAMLCIKILSLHRKIQS